MHASKFLGVLIDSNINWKRHIDKVRCKLNKSLYVLYKASNILDAHSLYIIYCSIILPHLSYCAEIWGGAYSGNLEVITRLQKKAVRTIYGVNRYCHTNDLFHNLNTLKFIDIVKLNIGIVMFKAYNNQLPPNVQDLFMLLRDCNTYNTRQNDNFYQVKVRTSLRQMCPSIRGVTLWNNLPDYLKKSKSLTIFKNKFKTYLIDCYENQIDIL